MLTIGIKDIYHQNLEIAIIFYLAEYKNININQAMNIYYQSELANLIDEESCGIENMSPQYLARDIIDNESQLFNKL